MGVFRLMTYILDHREQCAEYVDLIEIASQRPGGIEIMVDYYSFQLKIINSFWKSLSKCSGNPYLKMLGGEYGAIDAYVTKLVKDLKALDIHLVMFIDGAKGSSKIGAEQKLETWKQRHSNDLKRLHDLLDVIKGNKRIQDLEEDVSIRPVLLEVQMNITLKNCECEVVTLSSGEADFVIAKNLQSRPKAYAVLSNDTDFCIFENTKVILNQLFDIHGDLQLGGDQQWLPEKPVRLVCGVVTTEKVRSALDLPDSAMLIELAILAGNDFTTQFVRSLKSKLNLQGGYIKDVADWVGQHRKVENHQIVAREMNQNRHFASAVRRSRQFYTLTLPSDEENFKGYLSRLIDEGIQKGKWPSTIMAMHHNFYWHRMLMEDDSYGGPCVEIALAQLRSYIYRMVINRKENMVVDYGRNPWEELSTAGIYAAEEHEQIPPINNINSTKIFQNLKTFHRIMVHQEPFFHIYFFDRYGRRNGFTCLLLRYMLMLNNGRNLHIDKDEFMALAACIFCRVDEPWYCGLGILPTVRCITIGNWAQDVYRHAFEFLGKLLYLTHEFPHPKDMFSGSVFAAFYMLMKHPEVLRSFPKEWTHRIKHDINYIIGEKKHMIKHLVHEVFEFNDNFRNFLR